MKLAATKQSRKKKQKKKQKNKNKPMYLTIHWLCFL